MGTRRPDAEPRAHPSPFPRTITGWSTVGGDLRNGNITLPVIIYLRDYDPEGLGSTLLQEQLAPEQADEIVRRVAASPALRDTLTEAQGLVRQACDFLDDLPATPEVERLRALGDYVVQRDV